MATGVETIKNVWFFYVPCGRPRESERGEDAQWRLFLEAVVYRRRDDRPLAASSSHLRLGQSGPVFES